MSIAILHILPEATALYGKEEHGEEEHEEHHEEEGEEEEHVGGEHTFPVPYLMFFIGFMVMLLMDQVIFKRKGSDNNTADN